EPRLEAGAFADHYDHREDDDYYSQPGALFRLLNDEERERLFANIARSMAGIPQEIIDRQLVHFTKADPAYGAGVSKALGVKLPEAACGRSHEDQRREDRHGNLRA